LADIKLATWNINSVRLRINLVEEFLQTHQPDVLCLQEIKAQNSDFPWEAFKDMGYPHMAVNGQKGYHGVATVARIPMEEIEQKEFCGKGDSRHVSVRVGDDIEVHNFYVPAGGDIADAEKNEKFQHKMDFLSEVTSWYGKRRNKKKNKLVLVGDLNIAPLEHDVWDHKKLLKVVSHTPIEVEAMDAWFKSHNFYDPIRDQRPEPEKIYTWWSYRAKDWDGADKGRRLDHIWVSQALKGRVGTVDVIREARGWERPSDHAPVLTTIAE